MLPYVPAARRGEARHAGGSDREPSRPGQKKAGPRCQRASTATPSRGRLCGAVAHAMQSASRPPRTPPRTRTPAATAAPRACSTRTVCSTWRWKVWRLPPAQAARWPRHVASGRSSTKQCWLALAGRSWEPPPTRRRRCGRPGRAPLRCAAGPQGRHASSSSSSSSSWAAPSRPGTADQPREKQEALGAAAQGSQTRCRIEIVERVCAPAGARARGAAVAGADRVCVCVAGEAPGAGGVQAGQCSSSQWGQARPEPVGQTGPGGWVGGLQVHTLDHEPLRRHSASRRQEGWSRASRTPGSDAPSPYPCRW